MGIVRGEVKLLMREGNREKFSGKILTIGRQDIHVSFKTLVKCSKQMNFQLGDNVEFKLSLNDFHKSQSFIRDDSFFESLGFDTVESIDYSSFEGSTIVHDLNTDIPGEYREKYDCIFDGGTSEHVFNFPKLFENYFKMLKTGGRLISVLPCSNFVDHGFYMFSPTLFYDYFTANRWEIVEILIVKHMPNLNNTEIWDVFKYEPGCLNDFSEGALNNAAYSNCIIVRKTGESTHNAHVQQRTFTRLWESKSQDSHESNRFGHTIRRKLSKSLPLGVKRVLYYLYKKMKRKIPLQYHLERIGRF
jgi:SAM-dependent methyltransferase